MMKPEDFLSLVHARRGHFLFESGYHSDLWLDLETLCSQPAHLRPFVAELASSARSLRPDVVCGPLIEGALVGLMAAEELGCPFSYTVRVKSDSPGLFPIQYQLPHALVPLVSGRRVLIVNDVVSAGSAVRGTLSSLNSAGAQVVGFASLVVLGESFPAFAAEQNLPLKALLQLPKTNLWDATQCPLCAAGADLERRAIF
jgi:orotate phosphoribosyltransferase